MTLSINSNLMALVARNNVNSSTKRLGSTLQRLSSGLRVNSSADDPGALQRISKLTSEIRGSNQALRNTNDFISLVKVADAALAETTNALQRMRELAVQASNSTYTTADREDIDTEFQDMISEINRLAFGVEYNDQILLLGSFTGRRIQVGANSGDYISLTLASARRSGLGISGGVSVGGSTVSAATAAISHVDTAIASVSNIRASLGSLQNRLESVVASITDYSEELTVARSNIMDADISQETSELARNSILQQAGAAVLAQANLQPRLVLSLLNGLT